MDCKPKLWLGGGRSSHTHFLMGHVITWCPKVRCLVFIRTYYIARIRKEGVIWRRRHGFALYSRDLLCSCPTGARHRFHIAFLLVIVIWISWVINSKCRESFTAAWTYDKVLLLWAPLKTGSITGYSVNGPEQHEEPIKYDIRDLQNPQRPNYHCSSFFRGKLYKVQQFIFHFGRRYSDMPQTARHLEILTEIIGLLLYFVRFVSCQLSHMFLLKHLWYLQHPSHNTIVISIVYQWDDLSVGCQDDQDLCRLDYDRKQIWKKMGKRKERYVVPVRWKQTASSGPWKLIKRKDWQNW